MTAIEFDRMIVPALPAGCIEGWVPRAFACSASAPGSPLPVALVVVLQAGTAVLRAA